ncbi:MAG: NHL repeat-containing protein [Acidobacteriota bacterium]|nr:NHL repeat-containing protein [Acidobacteriota bacterium]
MRNKGKKFIIGIILIFFFFNLVPGEKKFQTLNLKEELTIGDSQTDSNQMFYYLTGSFIDADNNFYLVDKGNSRIQVFDRNGKFIRTIGKNGQGPGEFESIVAGAIFDRRLILAADDSLLRVNVYDLKGDYSSSFKIKGKVSDLICSPDNKIYLAYPDAEGRIIHQYDLEGNLINSFGSLKGKELLYFNDVVKMSQDEGGNFYVAIRYTNRIQKYDQRGKLLKEIEADLPFTFELTPAKDKNYEAKAVFLDLACDGKDVYTLTAPQLPAGATPEETQQALKTGNYMIVFDQDLKQKETYELPYLALAVSFDNFKRILVCDVDFVFHVCQPVLQEIQ